jgi:hypothetical protein
LLDRRPSNSNLLIHEKEREHPNREGFHTLIRERLNPGLQKESTRPGGSNSGIYSQLRALMQSIESPGKESAGKVKIYYCICGDSYVRLTLCDGKLMHTLKSSGSLPLTPSVNILTGHSVGLLFLYSCYKSPPLN